MTRPVAIFRHVAHEGPGYLAEVLEQAGIPWKIIAVDRQEPVPASAAAYTGLVFMGGPMSVNDDLPWIEPTLALIRDAVVTDVPVLGHCLGGQLLAKALGGTVGANPVKEIGWGQVAVATNPTARNWFGDRREFAAFHWHGETFSLPAEATCILSSPYCRNQAFALDKHLGLQCHVEMTEAMVREWCRVGAGEIAAAAGPGVQPTDAILAELPTHLPEMQRVADHLYRRWLAGLATGQ